MLKNVKKLERYYTLCIFVSQLKIIDMIRKFKTQKEAVEYFGHSWSWIWHLIHFGKIMMMDVIVLMTCINHILVGN